MAILDWELPGTVGVDIVKNYRQKGGSIGIIMLTGKSKIEEKETGFDVGADDYLTKPFNIRELAVRVRALLKRSREVAPTLLTVGDLQLDLVSFALPRQEPKYRSNKRVRSARVFHAAPRRNIQLRHPAQSSLAFRQRQPAKLCEQRS